MSEDGCAVATGCGAIPSGADAGPGSGGAPTGSGTRSGRNEQGEWRVLGTPDGMDLFEARCLLDGPDWVGPIVVPHYRVHLGRSGAYLRRLNGRVSFLDAASLTLTRPGDELSVAHPLGHGDVYTCLEVPAEVLAERPDAQRWLDHHSAEGVVDDRLDLEHRLLVAECRRGLDPFETAERLHRLLARIIERTSADAVRPDDDIERAVGRRPATLADHRRLADRTREVLAGRGYGLGLADVAREVGCSPHHLSRVFHRVTGQSLSAYRNQLRVRSVLHTLTEGATSLREVAAEHRFADQAHLTRVVHRHLGHSPARLRRMLTPGEQD